MSGWTCPHEVDGQCRRVKGRTCDPGRKGCLLHGRFRFLDPDKNRPPAKPRRKAGPPRDTRNS